MPILSRPEILCGLATLTFVSSLYVWKSSRRVGARDEKDVIIRRLISTFVTCAIVHWLFGLTFAQVGFSFRSFLQPILAGFVALFLTVCLFLGPVVLLILDWNSENDLPSFTSAITWRNLFLVEIFFSFFQNLNSTSTCHTKKYDKKICFTSSLAISSGTSRRRVCISSTNVCIIGTQWLFSDSNSIFSITLLWIGSFTSLSSQSFDCRSPSSILLHNSVWNLFLFSLSSHRPIYSTIFRTLFL
jgi:hypothetical protein